MTRSRAAAMSVMVSLLVSACASSTPPAAYPARVAAQLQGDVLEVTRSAAAKDAAAATGALARLREHVAAARSAGSISGTRAAEILAAASRVTADLVALADAQRPRSTPTAARTPTTRVAPAPARTAAPAPRVTTAPRPPKDAWHPKPEGHHDHHDHHDKGGHGKGGSD